VLRRVYDRAPRLRLLWADQRYAGGVACAVQLYGWTITLMHKLTGQHAFVVLPPRPQYIFTNGLSVLSLQGLQAGSLQKSSWTRHHTGAPGERPDHWS
jgi:hypothetical protein